MNGGLQNNQYRKYIEQEIISISNKYEINNYFNLETINNDINLSN